MYMITGLWPKFFLLLIFIIGCSLWNFFNSDYRNQLSWTDKKFLLTVKSLPFVDFFNKQGGNRIGNFSFWMKHEISIMLTSATCHLFAGFPIHSSRGEGQIRAQHWDRGSSKTLFPAHLHLSFQVFHLCAVFPSHPTFLIASNFHYVFKMSGSPKRVFNEWSLIRGGKEWDRNEMGGY